MVIYLAYYGPRHVVAENTFSEMNQGNLVSQDRENFDIDTQVRFLNVIECKLHECSWNIIAKELLSIVNEYENPGSRIDYKILKCET